MSIERYNYEGDTNIGFYATVTPEYAIYPYEFRRREFFELDNVVTRIAGTNLVGLFTAGNSNCLLVPETITTHERKKLDEAEISYQILESNDTALGNLILANDKGAYISEKLSDVKEEIEEALEVPVTVGKIAGISNVGVCGIANNKGAVIHRGASEEEAEKVAEALDIEKIDIGTINMGSPYVASGILCNDTHFLVGEDTTGPELGRIDQMLVQD